MGSPPYSGRLDRGVGHRGRHRDGTERAWDRHAASIRVSASFSGVVGFKPTFGLVPTHGVVTLSWSMDHCAPMASSVADVALLLDVVTGRAVGDPSSVQTPVASYRSWVGADVRGLRVGVPVAALDGAEPEIARAFGPLPKIRRVIVREVPSAGNRRAMLERGDADVSFDLPPKDFSEMAKADKVTVVSHPVENAHAYVGMNVTSALDVSVQAVILHLLADLRERLTMTYLFVSHDLNLVRLFSDRVMVMYLGRVVEIGPADRVFEMPRHPYTRALLSAVPTPDPTVRPRRILLAGEARSPVDPSPSVCRFSGRCPEGFARCEQQMPRLRSVGEDHEAACHLLDAEAVRR